MATMIEPFTPTDTVPRITDPVTREVLPPRLTTTDEQESEAISYALTRMLELRIWIVAVEVEWTRRAPTTLTIKGHMEHLAGNPLPVFDKITEETDRDGTPVDRSPEARFLRLQAELATAWDEQQGL